ncbi:MAG: amidohydrolase [Tannerellaceae bacterium]|jgi:predicted amidohydrolase|nr:amidohydrolase [Tannerellaceae bacterium]
MTDTLHITMIQAPIVWENREENLSRFGRLLRRASGKTHLAVLPEMFTTGFSMNVEALADTADGTTVATLKAWAKEYRMAIAGSFIAEEEDRYYNRAFFVTPEGDVAYYDKRHLFSMAGENNYFTPGSQQTLVHYLGWNICLQICYDLRFPVWSRNVHNAYDLLIYVANWPETRIGAWQALLPARAVENLAYVCAVNRTGTDGKGHGYGGRSVIISPKGEILADAGTEAEAVCTCTVSRSRLKGLRTRFPAWMDADTFILR